MSRIMQKEIKSEMNDFFFAKDHLDFYHEYVNVEQKYLAGIKEVRTKLEILDDEFHHRLSLITIIQTLLYFYDVQRKEQPCILECYARLS